ncbi:MAG: hypothetical protein KAG53_07655 [Endozoicomonadaceae bacterium]|nr:hypothetical protein [Endozoicomonadaceae bacterium]
MSRIEAEATRNSMTTTQPSFIKKLAGNVVVFVNRIVMIVAIVGCAILFTLTGILAGVRTFLRISRNYHGVTLSDKLQAVIAIATYPIPIIGPVLYKRLANDHRGFVNARFLPDQMDRNDLLVTCMPFVSSYVVSLTIFLPDIIYED